MLLSKYSGCYSIIIIFSSIAVCDLRGHVHADMRENSAYLDEFKFCAIT